jgi:hypothetical protein
MPLKFIGAGYGRTGTMSLFTALNQLGFPCYHMFEVINNKANRSHLDFWRKVGNTPAGMQHDWEQVFANYTAAVDFPASCVWRELAAAYPEAKIILTLHPRGAETWYESTVDTIYAPSKMWQADVLKITPFGRKMSDMTDKLIWKRTLGGTMDDRAKAIARYNANTEDVIAAIPPERLLVFSVDQGWEPLCKFLGVPVPNGAFPNVNDRPEIKKRLAALTNVAYAILAAAAVIAAGVIYGIVRLFG